MPFWAAALSAASGAACGSAPLDDNVVVTLTETNADGSASQDGRVESLTSAPVTIVPDAQRSFGPVDRTALLDVEVITSSLAHVHVVIQDSAAKKHVEVPTDTALQLTMEGPCCIGPQLSSAILVDDSGLLAAGVETGGLGDGAIEGTGLTLSSAGATELPQVSLACFADDYNIAVRVEGDDAGAAVTLHSGESAGVVALGHVIDVHDVGSSHVESHCIDSITGDVISWSAARIK
jgi:hypothetical protein